MVGAAEGDGGGGGRRSGGGKGGVGNGTEAAQGSGELRAVAQAGASSFLNGCCTRRSFEILSCARTAGAWRRGDVARWYWMEGAVGRVDTVAQLVLSLAGVSDMFR